MNTRNLACLLVLFVLVLSQPTLAEKIPLPERIVTAKKLFLVNDGCRNKLFEKFYAEVTKDGFFDVVQSPEEADLIATLAHKNVEFLSLTNGDVFLTMADPKTRDQIWTDAENGHYSSGEKMVKNLKKRILAVRKESSAKPRP